MTQSESNNLGWNIYRSESSLMEAALQLNYNLIPGSGTCSEPTCYSYEDESELTPEYTYYYWLESVSGNGETESYGHVTLTVPSSEEEIPDLPDRTKLYGNYPNPFNPITEIKFDIKENETGDLSIYNIKGQIIERHKFEAGFHTYTWEADNVGSGVYFYRLETASYSKIEKMVMVK